MVSRAILRAFACVAIATLFFWSHAVFAQIESEPRGGLRVSLESGEAVDMPLTGLGVDVQTSGSLVTVQVEQTYENPFDERIEAVYIFPLPEDAAVTEMVMVVGERRIRAELQEREEARRTYERARERGQTTSLLEQERPNVFTQSVANIEPGYPIQVLITYVEQLEYADGSYHFDFPMVVGPRFIPGEPIAHAGFGVLPDTDVVSDASRITPPILPGGIEAPYEVDFRLDLDTGFAIRELVSTSHDIEVEWDSDSRAVITLPEHQRQPNRDVVISYAIAESEPEVSVLTHHDERGGFFTLQVEPPTTVDADDIRPKELVFVIDMSGSMYGRPLDTSKAAIRHALRHLNPDDTFQVVRFSDDAGTLAPSPLANTPENVAAALAFVDALEGMGGTSMTGGVRAALEPPNDPDRMRIVLFLTDGYIGNESQVLDLIDSLLGQSRIFGLGVGSSVNRFLLDKMAEVGRGSVHYVNVGEDTAQVVEQFYERFRNPILTDIAVDWGSLAVDEVTPTPIPDLFAGTPLLLTGRYSHADRGVVEVSGRQGTRPVSFEIDVDLSDEPGEHDVIPYVWARRRVDAIEAEHHYQRNPEARALVLPLALEFGLMTRYTSFVAVEERIVANADDPLRTFLVAVPLPDGVSDERIGTQVSPDYVQPGDPELTVRAPDGTLGVTAYFPFDLVQALTFDHSRQLWTSRFLVPRDFEDGEHEILVAIEHRDGEVEYELVPLWVDSTAPGILVNVLPGTQVEIGDVVTFSVRLTTPTWHDCEEPGLAICAEVLPERIKFVRIYLPDGRAVRMFPSEEESGLWEFHYRLRPEIGSGVVEIPIEAVDAAGNTTIERVTLEVAPVVARR